MPPTAYLLTRRDRDRVEAAVRNQALAQAQPRSGRAAADLVAAGDRLDFVKITSTSKSGGPSSSTYYPGHWYEFDPATAVFTLVSADIWVYEVNGGSLSTGVYYRADQRGDEGDGKLVWLVNDTGTGTFSGGTISAAVTVTETGAATSTPVTVFTVNADSSGTPAAGFGVKTVVGMQSTTTTDVPAANVVTTWLVATHAGRTVQQQYQVIDFGGTYTYLTVTTDGTTSTSTIGDKWTGTSTGALNTAPTGYFVLPQITITGTPTFTVAEGSPFWNSVDNALYVSLGGGNFTQVLTNAVAFTLKTIETVATTTGGGPGMILFAPESSGDPTNEFLPPNTGSATPGSAPDKKGLLMVTDVSGTPRLWFSVGTGSSSDWKEVSLL